MNRSDVASVTIRVDDAHSVSGLLLAPATARACYVLAHGAGAGRSHPFMDVAARELSERGIATLRYQFPYMEQRARRPDPPKLAHATVRAAVAAAAKLAPALALVAGGKSFGGRMTSQAQAATEYEQRSARAPPGNEDCLCGSLMDMITALCRSAIRRADH
jgi:uncharacterized protein